MVDFARVQNRIYYGYDKAATRLGTAHTIYRSSNGINPIQVGNIIGTKLISIDEDLKYNKARKSGDMIWYLMPQDGLGTTSFALQNYDYMVAPTTPTVTYFIADIAPYGRLSPPICVECNGSISITRPSSSLTPGSNSYQQYQPSAGYLQNCPCAILQYGKGHKELTLKLPTSSSMPIYQINFPVFDDIVINVGDILTDDQGRNMQIISAEITKKFYGFRLLALQLGV